MPFEFIDHTADPGVRVTASTLPALLEAPDVESLLVTWLNELLFHYDTERRLTARATVDVRAGDAGSPWRLAATVRGERLDPRRHAIDREVKAVTGLDRPDASA